MTGKNQNNSIILGQKKGAGSDKEWILSIGSTISMGSRISGAEKEVKLDSSNPHVIFVCGARGSGKSYTLGVLAEEIAQNDSDIAIIIVDPIGVFWSMKHPNQEEEEIEALEKNGVKPQGIENLKVFVPSGYKTEIPSESFDTEFSFKPSRLTAEDWCLTFGIDRYSPQGLLLERAIEKVESGYTRKLGDRHEGGSRDVPPNDNFSISDLLECINHDRELLSKEKGFRGSTRRALTSRLTAAQDWGIFGKEKKLSDLVNPGTISVIDISFLPENIGALVLGILARKILRARKIAAREEAVKDLEGEEGRSGSIPPTWLMVDEAHSFAPSSGKTAATDPLIEYVKQGRRPGLSAVLSTQQPSALNSKIISQLDILLSHRLSFENDIKEVWKRMPATLPKDLKEPDSLKKLPEGTVIAADKEINKAFFSSIRPRLSQHEGRERVTKSGNGSMATSSLDFESKEYEEAVGEKSYSPREEEALVVSSQISWSEALELTESKRKKLLKVLWPTEQVREISKHYYPIWSALIDYYPPESDSINVRVQIDGLTGELIQKTKNGIGRTRGVRKIFDLKPKERKILFRIIQKGPLEYQELKGSLKKSSGIDSSIEGLLQKELIESYEEDSERFFVLGSKINIPKKLSERSLLAAEEMPDREPELIPSEEKINRVISEDEMLETLEFFEDVEVIERELFYYPYWIAKLTSKDGIRILALDGVSGERDPYAERMLRRRID